MDPVSFCSGLAVGLAFLGVAYVAGQRSRDKEK